MEKKKIIKLKKTIEKYFYFHMRNGDIHEVERQGRDIGSFVKDLEEKKILEFYKEGIVLNSVDVVEITTFLNYVKFINQRRPKTFFVDGKIRELKRDEIY
jgi:hypothetical protein